MTVAPSVVGTTNVEPIEPSKPAAASRARTTPSCAGGSPSVPTGTPIAVAASGVAAAATDVLCIRSTDGIGENVLVCC